MTKFLKDYDKVDLLKKEQIWLSGIDFQVTFKIFNIECLTSKHQEKFEKITQSLKFYNLTRRLYQHLK